jgi:hypothetical protein
MAAMETYDLRLTIYDCHQRRADWEIVNRKSQIVNDIVAPRHFFRYVISVNRLTKQEQLFLVIVLGLLLTGWAVKAYRTAHPPAAAARQAKP